VDTTGYARNWPGRWCYRLCGPTFRVRYAGQAAAWILLHRAAVRLARPRQQPNHGDDRQHRHQPRNQGSETGRSGIHTCHAWPCWVGTYLSWSWPAFTRCRAVFSENSSAPTPPLVALLAFKDRYNREWLIERHGHQTPAAVRAAFAASAAA
jgi:hypothetical protein